VEQCGNTHLNELVPAGGDDDGVLGVGREAHARNPLGVALVGDGVLAVTERVPELDGSVARTGDDLAVVGGEGDGENVVGVADKAAGRHTGGQLPEAERLVPRRGKGVGTVRGDDLFAIVSSACSRPSQPIACCCCCCCCYYYCGVYVRSRRQCASGRGGCVWGSRTRSRRGSSSR
jgi:hypothetical protein